MMKSGINSCELNAILLHRSPLRQVVTVPMLVSCGLSCTNLHRAVGERLQDKLHHASLGRC